MSIDDATREEIAASLYEAHRSKNPIDPPTEQYSLTIEDAYEIQSRLVDRRLDDGAEIVGHKVGLTSDGIQEQFGVNEPDFGRLLDTMFVEDGAVPVDDLVDPRIEPEIGFVLGEDLEPPVTYLDVLSATHGVVPVLEIIDSRIADWDLQIQDTIADNASSGLYATGDTVSDVRDRDLSLEGVKLYRNGKLESSGVGAAVSDHPARAVAWLANTIGEHGERLKAGQFVLSGSFVPAVDIAAGDVLTAEFGSIDSVTVRVSE